MVKLWRIFVSGLAAIACVWLLVFRLGSVKDTINTTLILNESETIKPLKRKLGLTVPPLKSNDCPANENREGFATLLAHWHMIATFYKIPYIIGCGSLLGQYRNGDIIPWDEDVDVLVDINKFKALEAFGGKRNFEQGYDDKFHFVVQNDFERRKEDDRRRLSCSGKVGMTLGVPFFFVLASVPHESQEQDFIFLILAVDLQYCA